MAMFTGFVVQVYFVLGEFQTYWKPTHTFRIQEIYAQEFTAEHAYRGLKVRGQQEGRKLCVTCRFSGLNLPT